MVNADKSILKFVSALSHEDVYERKHAAWMLARLAEKGKAKEIVDAGAVPEFVKLLEDKETIVLYRAVWAIGVLAKKGQTKGILEANIQPILEKLASDETVVEICHPQTNEIMQTTIGELARSALEHLEMKE